MGVLLLKFAGPLQSWGVTSRFVERKTRHEPTKSGIVGILAAALGRRREEPIDDLANLMVAVRIDQPGRFESDFQTAHPRRYSTKDERWIFSKTAKGTTESLPLSRRYYLSDAIFVVGVEAEDERLSTFADALLHPRFPLYLGRRSCPPSEKLLLDLRQGTDLMRALQETPWQASDKLMIRRHKAERRIQLEVVRDTLSPDETSGLCEVVRDVPVSFSQEHRQYALRTVVHDYVSVPNPNYEVKDIPFSLRHDPMELLGEDE